VEARPARLFPLFSPDGTTYAPDISYPYQKNIFSSLTAGLICGIIPIGTILLAQIWLKSFADVSSGILGLLYSLATGTCFQVILKKSIGGLRPHFLAVCEPIIPEGVVGVGFNGIMYRVDQVCTGDRGRINNALQSFPSGHSEIAFAGLGYLTIYLFTHLRIPDRNKTERTGFWRMILVLMPLLLATYIACTLVLGYHHHATDCFFGAAIGIVTASLGYRSAYRSLFDGTTNWRPRLGRRMKRELEQQGGLVAQDADEEAALGARGREVGPGADREESGDAAMRRSGRRSESAGDTLHESDRHRYQ
jgi:diacylglycerol diphosphate phosphatase/phosphatidate phosphatase